MQDEGPPTGRDGKMPAVIRVANRPRRASYYLVAGLHLHEEMERLCQLNALGGEDGALARRLPDLRVRRASKRPRNRMGFCVPSEWRISVTAYPGIRRGDAEETLLHELVHLQVGARPEGRRWHGREFRTTLRRAMREAYGLSGVAPRGAQHGAYADALESRRASADPMATGQAA